MSKYAATEHRSHHLSVGAILKDTEGKFVLLSEIAGSLGMMTGTLEDDETLEQCLHREIQEELGATCEIFGFRGVSQVVIEDYRGTWTKSIAWFDCLLTSKPTIEVVRVSSLLDVSNKDVGRWPSNLL